jgi:hypothetical protein
VLVLLLLVALLLLVEEVGMLVGKLIRVKLKELTCTH